MKSSNENISNGLNVNEIKLEREIDSDTIADKNNQPPDEFVNLLSEKEYRYQNNYYLSITDNGRFMISKFQYSANYKNGILENIRVHDSLDTAINDLKRLSNEIRPLRNAEHSVYKMIVNYIDSNINLYHLILGIMRVYGFSDSIHMQKLIRTCNSYNAETYKHQFTTLFTDTLNSLNMLSGNPAFIVFSNLYRILDKNGLVMYDICDSKWCNTSMTILVDEIISISHEIDLYMNSDGIQYRE